jgi:hypothetical protein
MASVFPTARPLGFFNHEELVSYVPYYLQYPLLLSRGVVGLSKSRFGMSKIMRKKETSTY